MTTEPRAGAGTEGGAPLAIAIDGPAAAGKSTTARAVAQRLGLLYVDSGAMYRALAHKLLAEPIDLDDAPALGRFLARTTIDLQIGAEGETRVFLDGSDVTAALRDEQVGTLASRIAPLRAVREYLVGQQRALARDRGVVMEGRDIATVVLPDAQLKIYLDASLETRTERRRRELAARGLAADADHVRHLIAERDRRDAGREESPLRVARGAVIIDTSGLTIDEQVERVLAEVRRLPGGGGGGGAATGGQAPAPGVHGFYAFSSRSVRAAARLLFGLHVHGAEHLPARGGFILAANHVSFIDPPILGCASPRRLAYLAKKELFRAPGFRHLIIALGAFPIHRQTLDRQALETAKKLLAEGFGLLLFPEGTRVRTGEFGQGRPGVSLLAAESGVPVVPAYIGGTLRLGDAFLRRTPFLVRFGEPLAPPPPGEGHAWREELRTHTAQVMAAIAGLKAVDNQRAGRPVAAQSQG